MMARHPLIASPLLAVLAFAYVSLAIPKAALAEQTDTVITPTAGSLAVPISADPLIVVPEGGCMLPPAKASQADIDAFISNPDELLAATPEEIGARAFRLVGSDIATLRPLLTINPRTTPQQQSALAAALARVARMCLTTRTDITTFIQIEIERNGELGLLSAFLAITEFLQTSAGAARGAPGAGNSAAGIGSAAGGPATLAPSTFTPTKSVSFSFSGGGGATIASALRLSGGSQSPVRP
jgi:hypothetical protein